MSSVAAIAAWSFDPQLIALLLLIAAVYLRGLHRIRRLVRNERDGQRAACFLSGLVLMFVAGASPLDTFDGVSLSAHMAQHLIYLMLAPPLFLLGHPVVPMLLGLPKVVVKKILSPLLLFTPLRSILVRLAAPPVAFLIFAVNTIAWHVPVIYEAALQSPPLHALEHATFFWTGILFWWPVIRPVETRSKWPEWIGIPYLMLADILNTAISAFFVFSDHLLYPSYAAFHLPGITASNDQILAGVLMWVPGSVVYLIPVVILSVRLLSHQNSFAVRERVHRS